MNFSSPVFLFFFFPAVFVLDRIVRNNRIKNWVLAAASLVFFAFGQLVYVPLFLLSVLISYAAGRLLMKPGRGRKAVLIAAVVLDLLVLAVFKYTDFVLSNLNLVFSASIPLTGIVLPLGISFFTFQGMSYVIDTYRDPEKGTKDFLALFLFMAFFPQLVQGPILRFESFSPQLSSRETNAALTASGVRRFITGLAKKVIIAVEAGRITDAVFSAPAGGLLDWRLAWLGGICYALQIYYDFSGYSDMAVGLAQIFGFRIAENFAFPYGAASIRDFWRRWHITLSSWFRDYLYIPLGGSRKGRVRTYLNRMIVFLCTGIWHGANWTFVVWGILHGVLSNLENAGILPVDRLAKSRAGRIVNRIYTLLAVMLLFVLFRAGDLAQGGQIIASMFRFAVTAEGRFELQDLLSLSTLVILFLGIVFAGNLAPKIRRWCSTMEQKSTAAAAVGTVCSLLLFALCIFVMARGGFSPFIYFQF